MQRLTTSHPGEVWDFLIFPKCKIRRLAQLQTPVKVHSVYDGAHLYM